MRKVFLLFFLLLASPAWGAVITSITVVGNTGTVSATAHGLPPNGGMCITGSSVAADNVCGVVATVPNANSFTFTVAGVANCAATCGAVNPAKQIIILNIDQPSQARTRVNYLRWHTTTSGVAKTGASGYTAATPAELAAIARGEFIEIADSDIFASTTPAAEIRTQLERQYLTSQQALFNNIQPGAFFGAFFDGTWH